jgi:hypothetical protein
VSTKRADSSISWSAAGFSDFHDQAAGEVRPTAHQQNQRVEPPSVTGGQAGYVDAEPYLGMVGEFPHRLFENITVDKSDQADLLDRYDEFTTSDDASLQVAHSQQALEIVYFSCRRAHHRLESKEQSLLAQSRLNCRAYRQPLRSAVRLHLDSAPAHRSIAPSSLFAPSGAVTTRRELDVDRCAAERPLSLPVRRKS